MQGVQVFVVMKEEASLRVICGHHQDVMMRLRMLHMNYRAILLR